MPIHLDISRIDRLLVIVARGKVTQDDLRELIPKVAEAGPRTFAKIIDVSSASTDVDLGQMERIVEVLRGGPGADARGPVAFVIDPDRRQAVDLFSETTEGDRPINVFRSLHDAREWLATFRN